MLNNLLGLVSTVCLLISSGGSGIFVLVACFPRLLVFGELNPLIFPPCSVILTHPLLRWLNLVLSGWRYLESLTIKLCSQASWGLYCSLLNLCLEYYSRSVCGLYLLE